MKILFTGGYTLGSVTPLLAVAERLEDHQLFWVGTRCGPERGLVKKAGIKFSWIWVPKWRRYFDVRNFFAPIVLGFSVLWALLKLLVHRPDVIVTAGGFVGVPLVWAGRLLGVPSLLHNQDVRWGLANRLVAPCVKRITYALPDTMPRCLEKKAVWTGNPIRSFILDGNKEKGLAVCGFDKKIPVIMVIGGGTGAKRLNEIVEEALPGLSDYQVVHLAGRGKMDESGIGKRYCVLEFVNKEMGDLYAAADLVITRAGMGVLTELAVLGKCMLVVPLPNTHQQDNAQYFKKHGSAIVLDQSKLTSEKLVKGIHHIFRNLGDFQQMCERAKELSKQDAAKRVAVEILDML